MDKDFLKEKIGYYRNLLTLSWSSSFLLGSGVSWSLVYLNELKILFVPIGAFFMIALFILAGFLHKRIKKLLKEFNL